MRQAPVVEVRSCRHNGRIMWFVARRTGRKGVASASLWPHGRRRGTVLCKAWGGLGSQCPWGRRWVEDNFMQSSGLSEGVGRAAGMAVGDAGRGISD
jgi:hypothetical protein